MSSDFSPIEKDGIFSDLKINPSGEGNVLRSHRNACLSIHDLPEDLLLDVFLLNADMEQDPTSDHDGRSQFKNIRAINVTRISSQVCHAWRDLILGSPALWGRLIDLDYFRAPGVGQEWWNEVMNRSGISSLSIRGNVLAWNEELKSFFIALLDHHWSRIESIIVDIVDPESFPAGAWDPLQRPSETIKIFEFSFESDDFPLVLFTDHAPRLRSFQCHLVKFNHRAPWLTHRMRSLHVAGPYAGNSLTIAEWLDVLRQMPLLEELSLLFPFLESDETASQRALHLPNLQKIRLAEAFLRGAIFLECITPKIGCCLEWCTDDFGTLSQHPKAAELARRVISTISEGCFNSRIIRGLHFSVLYNAFEVKPYRNPRPARPLFSFYIIMSSYSEPSEHPAVFPLLNCFASCSFDNITTMKFEARLLPSPKLDTDIHSFFMLLSAVDTIVTNTRGLEEMVSLRDFIPASNEQGLPLPSRPIFPLLRIIKLERIKPETFEDRMQPKDPIGAMLLFLGWRNEIYCPIQVLDLTTCEDLVAVDVVSGLKVIWNDQDGVREHTFSQEVSGLRVIWNEQENSREYTCGS